MVGDDGMGRLLEEVRACTVCREHLDAGPRPIVQADRSSRIVIIGQAPGRRVHETGVPWNDPSGDLLRTWLALTETEFYDATIVALMPMGFCYPGSTSSGDRPPRPECAPLWHDRILGLLRADRLEVIIGAYAQKRYLTDRADNLTAAVAQWEDHLPDRIVLPHPSPRNRHWLTKNPWFARKVLPAVQRRVREIIDQ